jgi:hypothetical protein
MDSTSPVETYLLDLSDQSTPNVSNTVPFQAPPYYRGFWGPSTINSVPFLGLRYLPDLPHLEICGQSWVLLQ